MEQKGLFTPVNQTKRLLLNRFSELIQQKQAETLKKQQKFSVDCLTPPKQQTIFTEYIPPSFERRVKLASYHPMSKILVTSEKLKQNENQKKILQKSFENCRGSISDSEKLKNRSAFINSYSGGPLKSCVQRIDERQVIIIQKFLRGYLARKRQKAIARDYQDKHLHTLTKILHFKKIRQAHLPNWRQITQRREEVFKISPQKEVKPNQDQQQTPIPKYSTCASKTTRNIKNKSLSHIQPSFFVPSEYTTKTKTNFAKQNNIQEEITQLDLKLLSQINKTAVSNQSKVYLERKKEILFKVAMSKQMNDSFTPVFTYNVQDINIKDQFGNTPLFYSCKTGKIRVSISFIELGADFNIQCQHNQTPAHVAFKSGKMELINYLLQKGANLTLCDDYGFTPLGYANQTLLHSMGLINMISQRDK